MNFRKAKILVTMGPAIQDPTVLEKIFLAGANAVRFNFSHGTQAQHAENLKLVRSVAKKLNRPCAVLADLMGPKIRIDKQSYQLDTERVVKLVSGKGNPSLGEVGISHRHLYELVKPGQKILLDDGGLEIRVESVHKKVIHCKVITGGLLKPNKSLNVPGVDIQLPILSTKDKSDLDFIQKLDFDWIAASFVSTGNDVANIKRYMKKIGLDLPLVSKVENAHALKNLRDIIEGSEGVMVARGDLGVEVDLETIPTIQRNIIHLARELGKVTIVATQMLETMTENPRPTRAEVTDVSTAALERVDSLMLSGETAMGKYPVGAVEMMNKIINNAEKNLEEEIVGIAHPEVIAEACEAGVYFGLISGAKALVTISTLGFTPRILSTYRGNTPVIAACIRPHIYNRCALYYSVMPTLILNTDEPEKIFVEVEKRLKAQKLAQSGDALICVYGYPIHAKGSTNTARRWVVS